MLPHPADVKKTVPKYIQKYSLDQPNGCSVKAGGWGDIKSLILGGGSLSLLVLAARLELQT